MKIVVGADQYPEYINGAATFTQRLAAGLARAGHTVDLLWPSADGRHATRLEEGVRVHRLDSWGLPGRPRMQVVDPRAVRRQVDQVLQIARPDVVHVQSHLGLGRALLRAARSAGVPVLATNHFMPENLVHHVPVVRRFPGTASTLAWRDLERVFVGADLLTVPTGRAADLLVARTRLGRPDVVSCGVDLAGFAAPPRTPGASGPAGGRVLFVGRLEQEKHVDELVAAFALLQARPAVRLDVVGMGSRREALEAQVRALGLSSRVRFRGAVDDRALRAAYRRADVFAMPGTAELQSIATLEAMASGLPVVAADAMALPHLVRDGHNGRLFTPGDVGGLARALDAVLTDPRRGALGEASVATARRHSLTATVRAYEDRYARLVWPARPSSVQHDLAMAS